MREGEELVTESEKMAGVLNAWDCSVFTDEDLQNIPKAEKLYDGDEPLTSAHFTAGKVKKNWKL